MNVTVVFSGFREQFQDESYSASVSVHLTSYFQNFRIIGSLFEREKVTIKLTFVPIYNISLYSETLNSKRLKLAVIEVE